jgi:hypothetical protein
MAAVCGIAGHIPAPDGGPAAVAVIRPGRRLVDYARNGPRVCRARAAEPSPRPSRRPATCLTPPRRPDHLRVTTPRHAPVRGRRRTGRRRRRDVRCRPMPVRGAVSRPRPAGHPASRAPTVHEGDRRAASRRPAAPRFRRRPRWASRPPAGRRLGTQVARPRGTRGGPRTLARPRPPVRRGAPVRQEVPVRRGAPARPRIRRAFGRRPAPRPRRSPIGPGGSRPTRRHWTPIGPGGSRRTRRHWTRPTPRGPRSRPRGSRPRSRGAAATAPPARRVGPAHGSCASRGPGRRDRSGSTAGWDRCWGC